MVAAIRPKAASDAACHNYAIIIRFCHDEMILEVQPSKIPDFIGVFVLKQSRFFAHEKGVFKFVLQSYNNFLNYARIKYMFLNIFLIFLLF